MSGHLMLDGGVLLALVVWFVVVPLGLMGVFEALGVARSRAWVPFVNLATVFRLGGFSEYWLIALVIPPATVLGLVMLFVASHRITRRLGHSGWFTVLAVVMWWVWALAIGLRHERPRGASEEPLVWSVRRPVTALRLPSSDDATSASSPLIDPLIAAPPRWALSAEAPALSVPPVAPRFDPPPVAPRFDPPPEVQPQPQPQKTVPVLPLSARSQPVAQWLELPPADVPPVPEAPELSRLASSKPLLGEAMPGALAPESAQAEATAGTEAEATILTRGSVDQTVISPRHRPHWWVQTTIGSRIELIGTAAILGRRPSAHPLYPGAQLIMVTDDAMSVSATHAVLEYVDGEWQVTDLGSTNGVWLVDPVTGVESELGAHTRRRVTPRFLLGELGVQVVRNA